jgi:hypothetical protein
MNRCDLKTGMTFQSMRHDAYVYTLIEPTGQSGWLCKHPKGHTVYRTYFWLLNPVMSRLVDLPTEKLGGLKADLMIIDEAANYPVAFDIETWKGAPAVHGTVGQRWSVNPAIRTNVPLPASHPKFAVGDRFAGIREQDFFEIVAINPGDKEPYHARSSWHDHITRHHDKDLSRNWQHISGPTFKPPVKQPAPTCNCHAQITGCRVHAIYCNLA